MCVLTASGLDIRSKDCRMRLAVALVTPQGVVPAGFALICLLTGAWTPDELIYSPITFISHDVMMSMSNELLKKPLQRQQ